MKLVMRNFCSNEFLPGCDYTVVDADGDLMDVIATRERSLRSLLAEDSSLRQFQFWDWRPTCINPFDALDALVPPDAAAPFDEWIESEGGWALVGDLVVPDEVVVSTDCQAMTITAIGAEVEAGWSYYPKECPDVIRTAGVDVAALLRRISAPGRRDGAKRDTFFSQVACDRCSGSLRVRIMSWFTDETICAECSAKEADLKRRLRATGKDPDAMEGCGKLPEP